MMTPDERIQALERSVLRLTAVVQLERKLTQSVITVLASALGPDAAKRLEFLEQLRNEEFKLIGD